MLAPEEDAIQAFNYLDKGETFTPDRTAREADPDSRCGGGTFLIAARRVARRVDGGRAASHGVADRRRADSRSPELRPAESN